MTRSGISLGVLGMLSGLSLVWTGCEPEKAEAVPPPETAVFSDANNYVFDGSLDVPVLTTASGQDVTIDWSAVVDDIQCHGLDPAADVDTVGLIRFSSMSQADLAAGLSNNDLDQSQMSGYVQYANTTETAINIGSMSFFGTVIDVPSEYVENEGSYLLLLSTGTTIGLGARMLAFLQPQVASSELNVSVPSGCGVLDFTVELEALTPVALRAAGPWGLSWGSVTVDGQGNPFDSSGIDSVMLGFYEGVTAADLETTFLDLELDATQLFTLGLTGGTSANLADATDSAGAAFTGFYTGGTWLLALRCSRCYNPAPPFVTLVSPYYEAE